MPSDQDQPKIIIDSDWKSQAQAEKARLESKLESAKPRAAASAPGAPSASKAPAGPEATDEGQPRGDEEPRFEDLVALLASQAMSYMGYYADPRTGQAVISLEYAKLHIDLLGVLEEKSRGNLSEQEQVMMARTLGDMRMAFVELKNAVAKAVQEGRVRPMQGGAGAGAGSGGIITPGGGAGVMPQTPPLGST